MDIRDAGYKARSLREQRVALSVRFPFPGGPPMRVLLYPTLVALALSASRATLAADAETYARTNEDGSAEAWARAHGDRYTVVRTRTRSGPRPYADAFALGVDRIGAVARSYSRDGVDMGVEIDFGTLPDGTPGARVFNAALAAFFRRDYPTAIAYFEVLTHVVPENPMSFYLLALSYARSGDGTSAQVYLQSAVHKEIEYPLPSWGTIIQRPGRRADLGRIGPKGRWSRSLCEPGQLLNGSMIPRRFAVAS